MQLSRYEYLKDAPNEQESSRKMLMFPSVFIFQLYNEVQARRGANDITADSQKNGGELECGRGHHGNGHHSESHSGTITVPHHYSNGYNYSPNGYSYPVSHQNGYAYCHTNGVSEIGDLLQDYLGQGKQISRKNNGARHVVSKGNSYHFLRPYVHSVSICIYEETR